MKFVLWICCLGIIMPSKYVAGDYVVEVLVQSYNNPTNQRSDGNCCDNDQLTRCDNGCDNYFFYCLRDFDTSVSGNRNCLTQLMTSQVNTDAALIDFTQPTVLGLPNPLVFRRGGAWRGSQLYVGVNDQDVSGLDDLVDEFTVNIDSTSTPVGTSTTFSNLPGVNGYGRIGLTVTVLCAENYYGDRCQSLDVFDQCRFFNSVTCNGRGTCVDGTNTYTCSCESGFTGRDCETNINECESQSCNGRGTCRDLFNGFQCLCDTGYTGSLCETDVDDCVGQNCSGNGQCVDGVNSFSCDCDIGYTGTFCDQIDDCVGVTCSGNGQCVDGVNNFTCVCQSEFTGDQCSVEKHVQGSSSIGEIVGGVVGCLVVLMLAILLVLLFLNLVKNKHHTTVHCQGLNDAGTDHIETMANMVYGFSQQGMNDAGADDIETNTNIVYGVSQQGSGMDQVHYYDYPTIVREPTQEHIEMKMNIGYRVQ